MKLGVLSSCVADLDLDAALAYFTTLGIQTVEIGCGGFPGTAHADAVKFIAEPALIDEFKRVLDKYPISISALSVHGNPVHPEPEIAKNYHRQFEAAVLLAELIGVDTINAFSGCPGDSETSKHPNWVTCSWPPDFQEILSYQWEKKLIPYWQDAAAFALEHGIKRIALEMHPGFCVYNPISLLRLRDAVGEIIGANFDPSHLFWQGIDPIAAVRELGPAIHHFHAKDTRIDSYRTAINGVLDTGSYGGLKDRSWIFRTVGYGHDESFWRDLFSELRLAGYDGAISIEHEDALMSPREGLEKAVEFLKRVLIYEEVSGELWWV